jgi:predicted acyltransferase
MQTQSILLRAPAVEVKTTRQLCRLSKIAGRSVQVSLALYLLPVLIVVLIVGAFGMAMLAIYKLALGMDPTRRFVG